MHQDVDIVAFAKNKCNNNEKKEAMSFKYAASGLDRQHHIHLVPPSSLTYFYVFLLLLLLSQQSHAGCYHCCAGRNSSCKSTEETISQMRSDSQRGRIKLLEMRAGEQFPPVFTKNNEKIGRLILPDMVELQGKGKSEYLRIFEEFTEWQEEHFFIFGTEIEDQSDTDKLVSHQKGRPLIRYSLLNKHVPLKVGKVKRIATPPPTTSHQHSTAENYSFVCPPADCQVSSWSRWSVECVSSDRCGSGTQQRTRLILGHPSNGGAKCPGLDESRGCFKDCSTRPPLRIPAAYYDRSSQIDITTVALLLDYQYNSSRVDRPLGYANSSSSRSNGSTHWRHFDKQLDKSKHTYYCVHYELGWVNRNCVERKWKSKLSRKKVICAECQPEAQLHRNSPRCASDLEDGDKGFWKLIGPPSCSGIWRRISRTNDCKCFEKYPSLTPFLLV
uniref:Uncharacterized protein n=1 Tax=Ditylenchus dipsaci TaxID=166011 RepID=A0A915EEF4_9BILA